MTRELRSLEPPDDAGIPSRCLTVVSLTGRWRHLQTDTSPRLCVVTSWKKQYIVAVFVWTLSAVLGVVFLDSFPYGLFFVVSVIGVLVFVVFVRRSA